MSQAGWLLHYLCGDRGYHAPRERRSVPIGGRAGQGLPAILYNGTIFWGSPQLGTLNFDALWACGNISWRLVIVYMGVSLTFETHRKVLFYIYFTRFSIIFWMMYIKIIKILIFYDFVIIFYLKITKFWNKISLWLE